MSAYSYESLDSEPTAHANKIRRGWSHTSALETCCHLSESAVH